MIQPHARINGIAARFRQGFLSTANRMPARNWHRDRGMRIRLLTAASHWGGVEEHTVALARTLQGRGHDVAIVEFARDIFATRKAARDYDVPVMRLAPHRGATPQTRLSEASFLEWRRILRSLNADVLVFAKGGVDVGSWRMDLAARLTCGHYITIEHLCGAMPPKASGRHVANLIPGLALWWHWTRARRVLRAQWPHRIVSVCDAVHKALARDYAVPATKLTTVRNGIDVARFHRDDRRRAAERRAWGIPATALVFGTVARLAPVKGLGTAIEAFARMRRGATRDDTWLVLAGEGPERERLERLATAEGVNDRVVFPGFTDRPEDVYPALDVFVMPSLNEGLPLTLLEAMAAECVPIAMTVDGVADVFADVPDPARLGWRVEPGDHDGFADAMRAAGAMDPATLAETGSRARQHVVRHFDGSVQFSALSETIEASARGDF